MRPGTRPCQLGEDECENGTLLFGEFDTNAPDAIRAAAEIAQVGGLGRCNGCEAAIASRLGGELAMTGVVNRISRTEYEMVIKVIDAVTAQVAAGYTGLRMGANYAWPRGAKWLMERRVLASLANE